MGDEGREQAANETGQLPAALRLSRVHEWGAQPTSFTVPSIRSRADWMSAISSSCPTSNRPQSPVYSSALHADTHTTTVTLVRAVQQSHGTGLAGPASAPVAYQHGVPFRYPTCLRGGSRGGQHCGGWHHNSSFRLHTLYFLQHGRGARLENVQRVPQLVAHIAARGTRKK